MTHKQLFYVSAFITMFCHVAWLVEGFFFHGTGLTGIALSLFKGFVIVELLALLVWCYALVMVVRVRDL